VQQSENLVQALAYGLGGGLGFSLVIALFAGLRERTESADIPEAFRGAAISLVTAAFMALGFMGFAGMVSG
jgi:electron transport complex protein RnfA